MSRAAAEIRFSPRCAPAGPGALRLLQLARVASESLLGLLPVGDVAGGGVNPLFHEIRRGGPGEPFVGAVLAAVAVLERMDLGAAPDARCGFHGGDPILGLGELQIRPLQKLLSPVAPSG